MVTKKKELYRCSTEALISIQMQYRRVVFLISENFWPPMVESAVLEPGDKNHCLNEDVTVCVHSCSWNLSLLIWIEQEMAAFLRILGRNWDKFMEAGSWKYWERGREELSGTQNMETGVWLSPALCTVWAQRAFQTWNVVNSEIFCAHTC